MNENQPLNEVVLSPSQFNGLGILATKYQDGTLGPAEFFKAACRLCPALKSYHENKLVVDWSAA